MAPPEAVQEILIVPQAPAAADTPVGAEGTAGLTVTNVHGVLMLQLLVSSDSAIIPLASPAELLSAQARIYHGPGEGNVIDVEVGALPPFGARLLDMPETG